MSGEVVEEVEGFADASVAVGTALSGTGASSGDREAGFTVPSVSGIRMKSFIMPDLDVVFSEPKRG